MEKLFLIQHPVPIKQEIPSKLLLEQIIAHINFNIEQMLPAYTCISVLTQTRRIGQKVQLYCQSSGVINIKDNTIMFLNGYKEWQEHKIPDTIATGACKKTLDDSIVKPWCKWSVMVDTQEKLWQGYLCVTTPHGQDMAKHPREWLDISNDTKQLTSPINIMMTEKSTERQEKHTAIHLKKTQYNEKLQPKMATTTKKNSKSTFHGKRQRHPVIEACIGLWQKAHSPIAMWCHIFTCLVMILGWLARLLWDWTPKCMKNMIRHVVKNIQITTHMARQLAGYIHKLIESLFRKNKQQGNDKSSFYCEVSIPKKSTHPCTDKIQITSMPQQCEKILTTHSDMLSLQG